MISETIRDKLYQELEVSHPAPNTGNGNAKPAGAIRAPLDLKVQRHNALTRLEEQILSQLLFQLHTLFEFHETDSDVQHVVRETLRSLYALEEACGDNGSFDVHDYATCLFRKGWHARGRAGGSSLLTGLGHVEQASFFRRTRQEIAVWTGRFLLVERYHRLDARENENRLDRYRILRAQAEKSAAPAPWHFDDLLMWLEFRLLEQPHRQEKDSSVLSRELSKELKGVLPQDFFMGEPIQPALYLLLKCHQYCLSETIEPPEQQRLEQLFATRRLNSLLDLMRVVLHRTTREHRLPEVGVLLDQLQAEGFNIEHQGFRDPYEAQLVAPSDTERLENAALPLFLPLESLSGEFEQDLAFSRGMLLDWHRRILSELLTDSAAYAQALAQPLPRAHLIRRLVRFAVGRVLARSSWPPAPQADSLEEAVRSTIPEHVLKQIVRPRKGYEIRSRQELNQLISGEVRHQKEALDRIATLHRIQGYHDYTQFTRYIALQSLQEKYGEAPEAGVEPLETLIEGVLTPEWVSEVASRWGIEAGQIHPHTLESVQLYMTEQVPPQEILPELQSSFQATKNECGRTYLGLLQTIAPAFHRLLVAYGRHTAQLSRLRLPLADVPALVSLLAPPLHTVQERVHEQLKEDFAHSAVSLYRDQLRPYLLNATEWEAYLAWHAHRVVGADTTRFVQDGDLDGLFQAIERAAQQADLSPDALPFETVRSTLLHLLKPPEASIPVSEEALQQLIALLPRLDCAACGQSSCRDFARALVARRVEPAQCVQLPAPSLPLLAEGLDSLALTAEAVAPAGWLDLLNDRFLWRQAPEKETFENVLSVQVQKSRRLLLEKLRTAWDRLSPKPQIFKRPDLETLYRELCRTMGYEATERLREEERLFLTQHGEKRQSAEWRALGQSQDWLTLVNRSRQSRPHLERQDPARIAGEAYGKIFFLHQLGPADREIVLHHRYETHQDGFSRWWNEDLLTMNLPDFSIRDWEDFSKIIQNAYWHQESSMPAGDVVAVLEKEMFFERNAPQIVHTLLKEWIEREASAIEERRTKLEAFCRGDGAARVRNVTDLRDILETLADAMEAEKQDGLEAGAVSRGGASSEERLALDREEFWQRFQESNLTFDSRFACSWEELLPAEREALESPPRIPSLNRTPGLLVPFSPRTEAEASAPFITSWSEPLEKRITLVAALISACVSERSRERAECAWLKTAGSSSAAPLGSFRLLTRHLLRIGRSRDAIETEVRDLLHAHPETQKQVLGDAMLRVILKRQIESIRPENESRPAPAAGRDLPEDALFGAFPELKSFINIILAHHPPMDRERLLHYLSILARMEGNLDALTALLREIRETSDIIEAAWLRFTQERLMEGPSPKGLPGTTLGIPLLVSRLKDKEPVNRGLREGVSRKEKRAIAAAVSELLNFIRYHVLLRVEEASFQGNLEGILKEIQSGGYDLTGIEEDALRAALEKEWRRREPLLDQKIWIYTTVTARRLAAQHAELQEAEREFYKIRLDILKDEDSNGAGTYRDVASRRGVALGQIKEEMYRQLSDLLESERMATFQKRIRQIVDQLDRKREEFHDGWLNGAINRRTLFYLLRQYQKTDREPTGEDFERFLRDHWFEPSAELRRSGRPDRQERLLHLDKRFRAVLGVSLLQLEAEATARAGQDLDGWMEKQVESLKP